MHSFASIGQHCVLPAISRYRALHPDVTVEFTLLQCMPDLFEAGSDVSLVTATLLPNSDLVSYRLGPSCSILCASPGYVHTHGLLGTPADFAHHDCPIFKTPTSPAHEWTLEGPEGNMQMRVSGAVQANTAESLAVAIKEGMGIGMLPVYAAMEGLRSGTLMRILPRHILQKVGVYARYP